MKDRLRRAALRATGGTVSHRLCLAALCLFIAAITARTTGLIFPVAIEATQAPAAKPPKQTVTVQATSAGSGYAGTDTCVTCHDPEGQSITHSQHGQAKNPRSPAATLGCESCHGPGQAHVDDDAKGHIKKFKELKPAEVSETCPTCHNRGTHAGWEASTHAARNLSCTTCHSVHTPKSAQSQLKKPTETQVCATCHRLQVTKTERAVAHMPVREGKMSCSLVPQPARVDQQRQESEDGQLGRRAVHELSYGDARTDALRARARARELRHVPRPARILERSHAGRPHADALPALPHREQASGDALRQGPDHHQQEQPDVRPIVRELPLEGPRFEPSVGPVLHAVTGDTNMRRLSFISLILLVGAVAAPQRALAQAGTPPPAQKPTPAQTPAQPAAAEPAAAPEETEPERSLFALTDRELFIGARVSSIDGDPARFQRYQDLRDGLLFSGFRYSFAQPDGAYTFDARANNVGWRDQDTSPSTTASARCR